MHIYIYRDNYIYIYIIYNYDLYPDYIYMLNKYDIYIYLIYIYIYHYPFIYIYKYCTYPNPVSQQGKANTIRLQPLSPTHRGGGGNVSLWDSPSIHIILKTITITDGYIYIYIYRIQIYYHQNPLSTPGGGGNISLWDNPSIHIILKTIPITDGYIYRIQIYYHHNPLPIPTGGGGVPLWHSEILARRCLDVFFSPKLPCGPCDLVSHSEWEEQKLPIFMNLGDARFAGETVRRNSRLRSWITKSQQKTNKTRARPATEPRLPPARSPETQARKAQHRHRVIQDRMGKP